ncbi:MAG: hypothetical protein JKY70_15580 [Mucilaginibacter sp.]|nr:hypothetical protein [Mucilaginibacter sp.]
MQLKKILAGILMVMINYYMLAFFIGMLMTFVTVVIGGFSFYVWAAGSFLSLMTCIIYQFKRASFSYVSVGEIVLGNFNKTDILDQRRLFSVTRIPLFIIVVMALMGDTILLNSLGKGQGFALSNSFLYLVVFLITYNGLKNYFLRADWLSIMVFAGGMLFVAFLLKKRGLYDVFYYLTIVWLSIAVFYKTKLEKTEKVL